MIKRVFLIVMDSVGVGAMEDAHEWGDEGSNTLASLLRVQNFSCPTLKRLGLFNTIDFGVDSPVACYGRMREKAKGKDTTVGHWEIAGLVSPFALPTYPDGFPQEIIDEFEKRTGKKVVCNKPYSGTEVIKDYGEKHLKTGDLIVYTSADSVFQVAAHEEVVPVSDLYRYCEIAREMLVGKWAVGRVIARPFIGEYPFTRTANRHDYSLAPPGETMMDVMRRFGKKVISVGKIEDIFAGRGIDEGNRTKSNADGMAKTEQKAHEQWEGLCFTNLVDFDSVFGHRNDVEGYANALMQFDKWLGEFLTKLKEDDLLIITADHGCDPSTVSTDHSREYVPVLAYGKKIKSGISLGTRQSFADVSATILDIFGLPQGETTGESFWNEIRKD